MTTSNTRLTLLLLTSALVLSLAACGKKDDKKMATQVAVKVGSEEISVHQINQVLSRSNSAGASPQAAQAMSREVLEKLIDQQLAVEQATDKNLHRSPEVVSQIEAARRDILARAYLQQIVSAQPKTSAEETKKYFTEHPQLFSARRIFNVQEIVLPAQPGVVAQLREFAAAGKPTEEVAVALKAQNIKFAGGSVSRAAEQIPLELLGQIHLLKDGQSIVLETPQAITFFHLVSSQLAPVDEATALPRIEQFLANQRASQAVAANFKQLRGATTITYMGDFSKTDTATEPAADATAATIPATQPAKSNIEKGVAGLK